MRSSIGSAPSPCRRRTDGERPRPFDRDRTGLLAAGATVLVLESEPTAAARGARPLAVVDAAWGGFDPTAPPLSWGQGIAPLAEGLARGLARHGIDTASLDRIVSGASGARRGDRLEAAVLHRALGETLPPVLAPKGTTASLPVARSPRRCSPSTATRTGRPPASPTPIPPSASHRTTARRSLRRDGSSPRASPRADRPPGPCSPTLIAARWTGPSDRWEDLPACSIFVAPDALPDDAQTPPRPHLLPAFGRPLSGIAFYSYATSRAALREAAELEAELMAREMETRVASVASSDQSSARAAARPPAGAWANAEGASEATTLPAEVLASLAEAAPYFEDLRFVPEPPTAEEAPDPAFCRRDPARDLCPVRDSLGPGARSADERGGAAPPAAHRHPHLERCR